MGFWEERANLDGKVAVVTGGGGGLGRAIALDLARAGVDIAFCERNPEFVERTEQELRGLGRKVFSRGMDVRDYNALATFFEDFDKTFSRLDILVNVVGGTFKADFTTTNPRGWDTLVRTNFMHVLQATHAAVARMRTGGQGGSIINLTSIEAHRAAPGYAVYSAMKAGVTHLSRTLAVELAAERIRVNNIAPDMTPTEGMQLLRFGADGTTPDPRATALADRIAIPMGRKGRLEDIGNCALFLASDLSSYITGMTLHPDGGAFASSGWFNWPETGYANGAPSSVLAFLDSEG